MFTGIIEHLGTVEILEVRPDGQDAGGRISVHAPTLAPKLTVSQSVAVNGCCLTVVTVSAKSFSADLSAETIRKTSFGSKPPLLKPGAQVNLEAALTAGKEFGGHIVQGHVDTIGRVTKLVREGSPRRFLSLYSSARVHHDRRHQPDGGEMARAHRAVRHHSLHLLEHQSQPTQTR
jgi:riboflavin synthase alpha subunit